MSHTRLTDTGVAMIPATNACHMREYSMPARRWLDTTYGSSKPVGEEYS